MVSTLLMSPALLRHQQCEFAATRRALQLKQWRRGTTIYSALRALGASEATARRVAANSHCWWRNSAGDINKVLTIAYFDRLGLPRLS